ncbi:hypothetical protein K2224_15365 [Streptomyces sp. BHT-5-2]|uniref:hypothetical protein n=1 Tax=Streptomyces sp. BHT-5-2 TaxID=2866715 RepID=UPI001C8E1A2C|nr:hypothetical protein [Streptomyces sp. BHT-5-2]QZL04381.1 hypothetical protein K2224_15365 [Streptomyces sp. BHT-5-2]
MKRVRRLLAAIASLALTAALLALGTSQAAAAPATGRTAPHGHGTCTPVPLGSGAPKGAAWPCSEVTSVPPASARALGPAPRDNGSDSDDPDSPDSLCDKQPNSTRLAYCITRPLRWTYYGPDNSVIGTAEGYLAIYSRLKSVTNANWREHVIVTLDKKSEKIPAVQMNLQSTCIGQCTASAPLIGTLTNPGDHLGGSIDYSSSVGQDSEALSRIHYHVELNILAPGVPLPTENNDWDGIQIRCDAKVSSSPGCIIPEHLANVTVRESLYHAAAVTYEWAQKNLQKFGSNNFGTAEHPLHRGSGGKKEADRKRGITCRSFPDHPSVPDDSCDEFPFAMSNEGGNPPSACVDILPQKVGGVWSVTVLHGDEATARCVRSHVTRVDNEGVGQRELSAAVNSDRILEGEAFQVIIKP